jgi:Flp pilus assembly pilin Flp
MQFGPDVPVRFNAQGVRRGLGLNGATSNNSLMKKMVRTFCGAEAGQTLSEYALLLAFILMAVLGLVVNFKGSVSGVASVTNNHLAAASTVIN